jgi:hypothetical protein
MSKKFLKAAEGESPNWAYTSGLVKMLVSQTSLSFSMRLILRFFYKRASGIFFCFYSHEIPSVCGMINT